ncbi:hypothetical protein K7X08_013476 [Anisodus acutangulus]|uniref:Uncharacterized protein n=1 Tax=Anisodus acutangulus TaxID=402998 RepID=A0A9Q1LNT4_9SOLA|nr:hypothetical protein K7X08_013476 [Anisodus acutangulus]
MEEINRVQDVEDDVISDWTLVKEISEDAFNRQDPPNNQNQNSIRVWTMTDVYKYPISMDYAKVVYNLAWAHAVQNIKPLDELFVMTTDNSTSGDVGSSKEANLIREQLESVNKEICELEEKLEALEDVGKMKKDISNFESKLEAYENVEKLKEKEEIDANEN